MGVGPRAAPDHLTEQGWEYTGRKAGPHFTHKEVEACRWEEGVLGEVVSLTESLVVQGWRCGVGVPGWCPQGEPGATDSAALLSSVLGLME